MLKNVRLLRSGPKETSGNCFFFEPASKNRAVFNLTWEANKQQTNKCLWYFCWVNYLSDYQSFDRQFSGWLLSSNLNSNEEVNWMIPQMQKSSMKCSVTFMWKSKGHVNVTDLSLFIVWLCSISSFLWINLSSLHVSSSLLWDDSPSAPTDRRRLLPEPDGGIGPGQ